ncbi:MAG: proliferating cell nuclear antigen (pcna) [Rickettsiales bacterium]|nr:proliferating cell nuclear antigen (pcna) [Rickettsiales bacterium]
MSNKRKGSDKLASKGAKKSKNAFGDAVIRDKKYVVSAAAPDCTPLRLVAEAFQNFIGEANVDITPDGLSMAAMDVSHISIIKLDMPKEWFLEGFRCDYAVALGINFKEMHKIFSKHKSSSVAIQTPHGANKVVFSFRQPGKTSLSRFNLNLLDINSEMLGVPENIPYQTVIRIPTQTLAKLFTQNLVFGDDLLIVVTEDKIKFKTKGDTTTAVRIFYDGDSGVEFESVVPYKNQYPLKYLQLFSKAMEVCEIVELRMASEGDDMPLCIHCAFTGGVGNLTYYLSPRNCPEEPDSDDDEE